MEKIVKARDRLNAVLPLKANQESCAPEIKGLHQDPENREMFSLTEAIEFGDRFFTPLMS